jgi:YjbE family integral membrane protein
VPDLGFVSAVLSIIVIDLVLSGDNAVVIGMAARRLSPENRRRAIVLGGAGAVVLRMIFTVAAALLLDVPFLQAAGGLLLLYIAYKLIRPQHHTVHVTEADSLRAAIRTIVLADVVMSLDNILAVGGAAHGHLGLLLFGLALSIPILLLGSELVARLLGRLPILVYVGAVVLIATAVNMVLEDDIIHDRYEATGYALIALTALVSTIIILLARRSLRPVQATIEVEHHTNGQQHTKPTADPSASPGA